VPGQPILGNDMGRSHLGIPELLERHEKAGADAMPISAGGGFARPWSAFRFDPVHRPMRRAANFGTRRNTVPTRLFRADYGFPRCQCGSRLPTMRSAEFEIGEEVTS
jgi:hypothetical protein